MNKIPVFRPYIGDEEIEAVKSVLESKWIGLGPKTTEFEQNFAAYLGVDYAIGVSSCTEAMQLAIMSKGITKGEVLIPSMTFSATAHAALLCGLKPVLVDCNQDDLCINVGILENEINDNTVAIIPVHYGGYPCNMAEIIKIAKQHGLFVIEDVAHALGAKIGGKKVGTFGDFGAFSFQATKSMTTGEGGMVVTNDSKLAEKLRQMRWFGIDKDTHQRSKSKYSWYYEISEIGLKANMNDIVAAIGLEQLKKLDKPINSSKKKIAEIYQEHLSQISQIKLIGDSNPERVYWNYPILCDSRDDLSLHLDSKGISTSVHYLPVHMQPVYKRLEKEGRVRYTNLENTEKIYAQLLSLPIYPELLSAEVEYICNTIKEYYE